jgi:hypothetical protein
VRGYRHVFLADDNFTVMRRRARELLLRLAEWNAERLDGRVGFSTQVSIDIARDPEMLALCARAGFDTVFIGIETPNEESLAETMKRQNLRVDLAEEVRRVTRAGMAVISGCIVGFDHDGPDIFERQFRFFDATPIPFVQVGGLIASAATPLHARMLAEGRLVDGGSISAGTFLRSNIRPMRMTSDELVTGLHWLLNKLYQPRAFAKRIHAFASLCGRRGRGGLAPAFGPMERALATRLAAMGAEEQRLVRFIEKTAWERPELMSNLSYFLAIYCQIRYLLDHYGVWDPELTKRPPLAA